jgi:hypothetical protein
MLGPRKHDSENAEEETMLSKLVGVALAMSLGPLPTQFMRVDVTIPDLGGTYRCEPQPSPCTSGDTFTVTQSGDKIEFKSEKGAAGEAKLTSQITLSARPPWNTLGVMTTDNRIQWSNGTRWPKM